MPVSGYIVMAEDNAIDEVNTALRKFADIKIGQPEGNGLPIAVATDSVSEEKKLHTVLEAIPKVKSVTLIYHNFEDIADQLDKESRPS